MQPQATTLALIIINHSTPCLKKPVHSCFCHNFVKFPPTLIILGTRFYSTFTNGFFIFVTFLTFLKYFLNVFYIYAAESRSFDEVLTLPMSPYVTSGILPKLCPQSDLQRRAALRWALPHIFSVYFFLVSIYPLIMNLLSVKSFPPAKLPRHCDRQRKTRNRNTDVQKNTKAANTEAESSSTVTLRANRMLGRSRPNTDFWTSFQMVDRRDSFVQE